MKFDEQGQVGGVEAAIFGVLIFVFGLLIVANAWGAVDAKMAASSAAREGARALVESADLAHSRDVVADAVSETLSAHGRSPERAAPARVTGELIRCGRVTVEVDYRLPVVVIPILGGAGRGFTVTGRHSEIVDPFRSGLPGEASCE